MTPDIDLWLWALPSGQLEWRPAKGKMWMSVFLNRMSIVEWWKTHLCDVLVILLLFAWPALWKPVSSSTDPHHCISSSACTRTKLVSSCSLISYLNLLWFSPPSLLFLSLTSLEFWVNLHECFTVMPQFAYCCASLRQQNIRCMVHLGSVCPN